MTPAARAAALAALVPALLGATWKRTTDQACGTCAYWSTRAPVYVVNASGRASPQDCAAAATLDAVRASFDAWNGAGAGSQTGGCTDLALTFGGETTAHAVGVDGTNLVVFRAGPCDALVAPTDPCWDRETCGNEYDCWDTGVSGAGTGTRTGLMLALTWVAYDRRSGRIVDADMELDDWGGRPGTVAGAADGWYLTCTDPVSGGGPFPANACSAYGDASCIYVDLRNTVTHEAGHFVGLAHPDLLPDGTHDPACDAACAATTMYSMAPPYEIAKRSLEPGDVDGVCAIYPAGAPTVTCPLHDTGSCPAATVGCACGTGAGASGASALALVGVLLAAPRRRARGSLGIPPSP